MLAGELRKEIDYGIFAQLDSINRDNLDNFIRNSETRDIASKNVALWQKHCGAFPVSDLLVIKKPWTKLDCILFAYFSFGQKELFDLVLPLIPPPYKNYGTH